jgi:AdoMet-dependent heme synthase
MAPFNNLCKKKAMSSGTVHEPKPIAAVWGITECCNLACPHCYSAAGRKVGAELDHEECRRVIDEMAGLGVDVIGWTGGEPLLRNDLEDLISYAETNGIWSTVTTNGVLLDEKRAGSLQKAGIRSIQISLDGSTAEKNHVMRRASDEEFEKVLNSIRVCRKLNIKTYLATLLGFENLDDAPDMIALGKREGVACLRFCGFLPMGRGRQKAVQERLHFNKGLQDILTFMKEAIADDSFPVLFGPGCGPLPPDYEFHTCMAGVETFYIKGNGDVFPCTALVFPQHRIGNLRRQSLSDIWHDPKMTSIATYPREKITGVCHSCDNLARCHGACRGVVLAYTGDINGSLPTCLYQIEADKQTKVSG